MLSKEEIKLIHKIAYKLREICKIESMNFDIEKVIEEMGGKLKIGYPSNGLSGIKKKENNSFEIEVHKSLDHYKQRWFAAYEIGRLILYMKYKIDSKIWNSIPVDKEFVKKDGLYKDNEETLKQFAFAFLIPENMFLRCADKHLENGYYNLKKISRAFNVPKEYVIERGIFLNIWQESY